MKLASGVEKLIQKEGGELKGKVGRPSTAEKEAIASGVTGVFMGDFADFAKKYTGDKKVIAFKKKASSDSREIEAKQKIDAAFDEIFG
jgi:uncharacterized protein YvpB